MSIPTITTTLVTAMNAAPISSAATSRAVCPNRISMILGISLVQNVFLPDDEFSFQTITNSL